MLSDAKARLLQSFLGAIPGAVALRLAQAVELDRLMDGNGLPHDTILTALRPALRQSERMRTPTPLRLFCRPFEDILTSAPRAKKQKASIARASVTPVWQWLCGSVIPDAAAAFVRDAKPLIVTGRLTDAEALALPFWTLAGAAIRETLDADGAAARGVLKDDAVLADAREMAVLLQAGADARKIQAVLPRATPQLTEELLWQLREIYDALAARNCDAAPYVAVIAMNRLAKPWEALKLPLQISRQTQDTLISQTDMGLVGEILFSRMDAQQAAVMATRHPLFDAETLLEQVSSFAAMTSAIVKEIELKRGGEWGVRLMKERAAVGGVMDGFMDRAPKEVAAALPLHRPATGPKTPDFSRLVDVEKKALALRYVRLVVGSRNFAAAASFAAKQKTAYEEICTILQRYNEDVVKELRSADPQRKPVIDSQFEFCAELTALLFSEEEAELLRRRGRAAQIAA